jgi:galactokinase
MPSLAGDPKRGLIEEAMRSYRARFGAAPTVAAFAPGRVEVLGNHTDYNGGYILSSALERGTAVAAGPAPGGAVEAWSETLKAGARFELARIEKDREAPWADYLKGVVLEARRAGCAAGGMRLAIASDLPAGSGLSSSAALEVALAAALFDLFGGRPEDPMDLARLCQRAEAGFVGVPCGLMDQFSAVFGKEDKLLFLDCDSAVHAALPIGGARVRLVIADTGVRHALVDGRYAELRRSCERAVARLAEVLGRPLRFLRDASVEDFERAAARLPEAERRRAEHVVRENARVLAGRAALERGDLPALGRLLLDSHASSRDLFGNSCPELDAMVEAAEGLPGFLGGKLSGGGFGGATVNLVESPRAAAFAAALDERYRRRSGKAPRILESGIGAGVRSYRF